LRSLEQAAFASRVRDRNFDAALVGFDLPLATGRNSRYWHSSQAEEGANYAGLRDPQVDAWFDEAERLFDDTARRELYVKIDGRLSDLQAALFLWHPIQTYAVSNRVGGFRTSLRGPFGFHPGQRAWRLNDAGGAAAP
jgi:peptide/nickel transport system substrate-binding protein